MTKQELKQKFGAGQYPTEDDFAELIDMILTPTSEILQKNVVGLLSALQGKYDRERGESLEASIENLVNNLNAETTRAKQVESEKANTVDIANSLFKGTLYLNANSDAIYTDSSLTKLDVAHNDDGAGLWIIRGNSVVGIMSRGWSEATIYPHNARYLIHWIWSEEQGQWIRAEVAKSYTITEAERNKWNNTITNLSTETTRAQNAESALQNNIDKEKTRAQQAENTLSQTIETVAESALETFATKEQLTVENKRAVAAEQTLQKNITAETTRAQNAEAALQLNIDSETTKRTEAILNIDPRLIKGTLYARNINNDNMTFRLYTNSNYIDENEFISNYVGGGVGSIWKISGHLGGILISSWHHLLLICSSYMIRFYYTDFEGKVLPTTQTTGGYWRKCDRYTYHTYTEQASWNKVVQDFNTFLKSADTSNTAINRWKEIEDFLVGVTDTNTLTSLLEEQYTLLQKNIDVEKSRAEQAETSLFESIENMADVCLETFASKTALSEENERAVGAEQTLQKNITAETTRAQNAESALQNNIDNLKCGNIDTMENGAQIVSDENGKYGLLLTNRNGNMSSWRQRLITFTGIIERHWDKTIGNMGGNWSSVWATVLEWDKITTVGSDVSDNTLTLTGSNIVEDTTAIILQQATVYNNTLIL